MKGFSNRAKPFKKNKDLASVSSQARLPILGDPAVHEASQERKKEVSYLGDAYTEKSATELTAANLADSFNKFFLQSPREFRETLIKQKSSMLTHS